MSGSAGRFIASGRMPSSRMPGCSRYTQPGNQRDSLDEATTDWKAACGIPARTVRRAGSVKAIPKGRRLSDLIPGTSDSEPRSPPPQPNPLPGGKCCKTCTALPNSSRLAAECCLPGLVPTLSLCGLIPSPVMSKTCLRHGERVRVRGLKAWRAMKDSTCTATPDDSPAASLLTPAHSPERRGSRASTDRNDPGAEFCDSLRRGEGIEQCTQHPA